MADNFLASSLLKLRTRSAVTFFTAEMPNKKDDASVEAETANEINIFFCKN